MATAFGSALRKYHETTSDNIVAQAESKLEMPEVPSNTARVQV